MEPAPNGRRVALLSLHSHADRSYIDDHALALLSGDLAADGVPNDFIVAAIDTSRPAEEALAPLVPVLAGTSVVVFDRVWSRELVGRLRTALPGARFVAVHNEHDVSDPPADWLCEGEPRHDLTPLVRHLLGDPVAPTAHSRRIANGLALPRATDLTAPSTERRRYAPNVRPILVGAEFLPPRRTFSLVGNRGCPYQADARENPLYAGARLPAGMGRGCAFCTTGNEFVPRPASETAAEVLEQVRYLRREAPHLDRLVLKDQNPFAYLTELCASLAREKVAPFTLLLETRADWFLRSRGRFEQALAHARDAGVRLAPYLVGIENFSDDELRRLNKGTTGAENERFIHALREWVAAYPTALTLEHSSFGFVLFNPWTSLDDLRANLAAIRRTRFDELRGSVLLSRARLYPDTALYWLAERDGLLLDSWEGAGDDTARRYGYHASKPWKFLHPEVDRLARLAVKLSEETSGRDQPGLLAALLDAFPGPDADPSAESVRARLSTGPARDASSPAAPATDDDRARVAALLAPLDGRAFAGGWSVGPLTRAGARLRLVLTHPSEPEVVVELGPVAERGYAKSASWSIRHAAKTLTPPQLRALDAVVKAAQSTDR